MACSRVLVVLSLLVPAALWWYLPEQAAPAQPHLAQAWTAQSTGDGKPGLTGQEAYIYEDCPHGPSETCLQGHVWNYGADTCVKIEVNGGFNYPYGEFGSGTYYLKCDALNCCYGGKERGDRPDVKKWDIGTPGWFRKVAYLGVRDTTELNGKPVKGAEVWSEVDKIPLLPHGAVNYTYYITRNGTDVLTHRIDYAVAGDQGKVPPGSILYGDFQVVHQQDLAEFRKVFQPPAQCQHQVMSCPPEKVAEWERAYFSGGAVAPRAVATLI